MSSAVTVDAVSKTFRIPRSRVHTLKERVLHPLRRSAYDDLHALDAVTFDVPKGEFFGIVGRNGSGKSTLLKCMAGIYATDRGRICVDGRLSTFIELGVGFNPDLPARDNILLNATMLGLSPREARNRVDAVLDFAELHEFVDLKLKNYSSGMMVRLAFAVMIQVDADVLLIDEVLAVGDAAFQQKCHDEFGRLRRSGATVLLVTHDMAAAQRFCRRAMLLERGKVVEIGDAEHVANRYLEMNFGVAKEQAARLPEAGGDAEERFGDGRARVMDSWFEDDRGERVDTVPTAGTLTYCQRVTFFADVLDPVFSVLFESTGGAVVLTLDAGNRGNELGMFGAGEEVVVRLKFANVLVPDRFRITPAIGDEGGLKQIDRPMRMHTLTVSGTRFSPGLVDLPFELDIERSKEPVR